VTRFLPLLLLVPLAAAQADVIKLKSGEVIEGKITKSDPASITIVTQFSSTITDERRVKRSDIVGAAVASPDEAAFAKIRDLEPPATALDAQPYETVLNTVLRPFLKQFPTSTRTMDVKAKIKAFEADIARLKSGNVKVAGIWYDQASYAAEKYQIEAAGILGAMKREYAAKNYPAAMNDFDVLQRAFPGSAAYAEAVPVAEKTLEKLIQQLTFTIGNLPQTMAMRKAAIDQTPIEQRTPIERAIAADDARAVAAAEAAQRKGQRFFAILPYDEKGLKAMQQAAEQVTVDLKAINKKQLAAGAKLVRQAQKELERGQYDAVETTLNELQTTWMNYEGLGRMQQRVRSAQDAVRASIERDAQIKKEQEEKERKALEEKKEKAAKPSPSPAP
jgi:hypothetical protein